MQYIEFLNRVQEKAELPTREEAQRITEVTLETLGERLYRTERSELGSQLPKELEEMLNRRQKNENRQRNVRFSLEEFYKRVSARLDVRNTHGVELAKVVIAVLQEAVSQGEIEDVLLKIPSEYRELFAV